MYPDGQPVLGGAPFNVAWHLHGFGLVPLTITCVGDDEDGRKVIDRVKSWKMDTAGMQRDLDHPTGTIHVSYRDGELSFAILPEQSYDYIDALPPIIERLEKQGANLVYHGSLALRSAANQRTLARIVAITKAPIFLDVNLRDPWWDIKGVDQMLMAASWVKLNDNELNTLRSGGGPNEARDLLKAYSLDSVIVTKGGQGAFVVTGQGEYFNARPPEGLDIVDTVGAGDAFSAVCIAGLLAHWPWKTILERANDFAVRICGVKGGTTANPDLYDEICSRWQIAE